MSFWIFLTTHSGAPYEIAILISALLFISRKSLKSPTALKKIFIIIFAFILFRLIGEFLKNGIAAPRPCWDPAHPALVHCPDSFSLPSGHALGAFMLAIFLSLIFRIRQIWPISLILAILIALSRYFTGVHTILDITVGSILGIIFGLLLWKIYWKETI